MIAQLVMAAPDLRAQEYVHILQEGDEWQKLIFLGGQ